jgi:hypothetical protein
MWILVVTMIIVAAAAIWLWKIKKESKLKSKNPTYVCPECGDKNCNCYLEKEEQ